MTPTIEVVLGDILTIGCDVLLVKFAQQRHGSDKAVTDLLRGAGHPAESMEPQPGAYRMLDSRGALGASQVLIAGVVTLRDFGYGEIRDFARKSLEDLAWREPAARSLACTLHGAGYGLDERESFAALVGGLVDAIRHGDVSDSLASILVVERNPGRRRRLLEYLESLLHDAPSLMPGDKAGGDDLLDDAGYASDAKPHVFVAMPFSDAKLDVFHYGIQGAINEAGYLCERLDVTIFTGDVMQQVKKKIESAAFVVADLSGANANVYLEVGYAWGSGVQTVLICDDVRELKFDVKGHRCLAYSSIQELESKLTAELKGLQQL